MDRSYDKPEPTRAEVDSWQGHAVLEFGTGWCEYCQAAQPMIAQAFQPYPDLQHRKVSDGPGQPLGRSYRVKLWPTLIFLKDGQEITRVVRPENPAVIAEAMRTMMQGGEPEATS